MTLDISVSFDALYYSFYLEGLRRLGLRWRLRSAGFPRVGHHGLWLRSGSRRLFISASDGPGISAEAVAWADVIGKVNLDRAEAPANAIPIGPSFPVAVFSAPVAWALASSAWFRGGFRTAPSARSHFGAFRAQYRYRLPERAYAPGQSDPGYVFALSRLWQKEPATNRWRAAFIEAARSLPDLEIEGGFAPRSEPAFAEYRHLFVSGAIGLKEWVAKTQRSALVFNTPAVSGCHGWKLGEYLALGKAIVSTPPERLLPAPLEHGEHLHFVSSQDELARAIEKIARDEPYRRRLELGARRYYDQWLAPQVVMRRLLDSLEKK